MPAQPTFSVIVVCRNPGAHLRTTLASVWAQRDGAAELIVIDGGSTDGSREWLESRQTDISTLVSEPDAGIYDAMNKGVAVARGEWIYFLGADDRLAGDQVLREASALLRKNAGDVFSGEATFEDGRTYGLPARVNPVARNFVHHQATFYRRVLFQTRGGFDTGFAIMADYEFNLRLWTNGVRFEPLPLRQRRCQVHRQR
jgi:glycosyltransferase involved in cell wall biosynthesis